MSGGISDTLDALTHRFSFEIDGVVQILVGAGFDTSSIVTALMNVYNLTADQALNIIRPGGGGLL